MGRKARLKKAKKSLFYQDRISQSSSAIVRIENPLKRLIFFVLLLSILIVGVFLRIHNLDNVSRRSPDERIYTYQARTIVQHGVGGVMPLVREYNMNQKYWIYPPPSRIGYLWPLAAVMRMTNRLDEKVGAYISCLFSIFSLILLIVMGLRFFNPWVTLYALAFMSVSPMSLAIARRTWQDAMLGGLGLLLIYFCCEITRATHRIIWYILLIVIGSYSILVKESGAVIYALCIAWLLYILWVREKSFLKGVYLIVFSVLGIGISIAYLAHVIGGFPVVIKVWMHIKEGALSNIYAIKYQSGPWHQFFLGFWIVSPVNAVLYLVGAGGAFLSNKPNQKIMTLPADKDPCAIFGIIFFMFIFMTIAALTPWGQNLRYVSAIFVPFYLISGLGLWQIISFAKTKLDNFSFSIVIAGIVVVLILIAVGDYRNFKELFVKKGILDLSIGLLRENSR